MDEKTFMEVAWAGFLNFAIKSPDILAEYKAETGIDIDPPQRTPIENMVDVATGYEHKPDALGFIKWATEKYWGMDDAPEAFRKEFGEGK